MAQKITIDQYDICVRFKSDNVMGISAQFIPTCQYFQNETVELMRIKKDTVLATLHKKSQKNLRCQFEQFVDKDSKYLIIKFVVSFDFLPQFSEEVKLTLLQKDDKINKMQINNIKADMDSLEQSINSIDKNGLIRIQTQGNISGTETNKLKQIIKMSLPKGRYLLRMMGLYLSTLGQQGVSSNILFVISVPGQKKIQRRVIVHSVSGYPYPFSLEQPIIIDQNDADLVLQGQFYQANWSITNSHIILYPIPDFR